MDPHERLGPNQSAKIEAECLTTAQSTAKMQVRSGLKFLSVSHELGGSAMSSGLAALSAEDLVLLERWVPVANDSQAVLGEEPDCAKGKPWDNPDYVCAFRLDGEGIFLEVQLNVNGYLRIAGLLKGVTGVHAEAHPWGSALCLDGPIRWVGTRTRRRMRLLFLLAGIKPALGQAKTEKYDPVWPQLTLVLPCTWTP